MANLSSDFSEVSDSKKSAEDYFAHEAEQAHFLSVRMGKPVIIFYERDEGKGGLIRSIDPDLGVFHEVKVYFDTSTNEITANYELIKKGSIVESSQVYSGAINKNSASAIFTFFSDKAGWKDDIALFRANHEHHVEEYSRVTDSVSSLIQVIGRNDYRKS